MEKKLIKNSVKCLECNEILVSRHVHDYVVCACPNGAMCDGGVSYARYGAKDVSKLKDLCIYDDEPFEVLRNVIERGGRGKDGTEPLKYVVLSDIDDDWLRAIIDYEDVNRPNNKFLWIYKKELEFREKE